jgi:hypothetical protein
MKKASKLLWVLLAVLLAAVLVAGCADDSSDDGEEEDPGFTEWTPAYFTLATYGLTGDFNRFHLHGGSGGGGFVEIQKVLVNYSKSLEGAKTVLDFTATEYKVDAYDYTFKAENDEFVGEIKNGGTANGRLVLEATGDYTPMGNFGSGAAWSAEAPFITHWIFILRTNTEDKAGMGDIRFGVPTGSVPNEPTADSVRFSSLEF